LYQRLNSSLPQQPQSSQNNQFAQAPQINQIKNWISQLKGMGNPNEGLKMLISQNPQLQQVMNLIQQSGGDPKQVFMKMAQARGINPQQIINMLK